MWADHWQPTHRPCRWRIAESAGGVRELIVFEAASTRASPRPRLAPSGLRRRDEGSGLPELRDGLLNQGSALAGIPGLLRLRDQVPRLGELRHRVRVDAALGEHVDPVLRVSHRGLQARVLLPWRVT